jgi:hypothetical protein
MCNNNSENLKELALALQQFDTVLDRNYKLSTNGATQEEANMLQVDFAEVANQLAYVSRKILSAKKCKCSHQV